jgi:hypothetical protein
MGFGTRQPGIKATAGWMKPLESEWGTHSPGQAYSIQTASFQNSGEPCLRSELRKGEHYSDLFGKTSFRSEVNARDFPPLGSVRWYAFSLLVPDDFPIEDNRLVLAQWHGADRKYLGEVPRSPAMAFRYSNGSLSITICHSADRIVRDAKAVPSKTLFQADQFPRNAWNDFVIQARWSYKEDGFVNIWWNGRQIVSYSGPVGYNDNFSPYFKFGLYRDHSDKTYAVYFNHVKLGSRREDVGFYHYASSDDLRDNRPAVLTPQIATPHINGPTVFGVQPGSPFLYTIPTVGNRPMSFSVENLPPGLAVDSTSGHIMGSLTTKGAYPVVLRAKNALGSDTKNFRIIVGEKIALTPAMRWNSYNCWAGSVDEQKVLRSARAMVTSGLINHGWTYINIDDSWQGKRTGKEHALQGNEKFPNMPSLCDEIHKLGMKAGIYSTPWITSYGKYPGGSSDNADGCWTQALAKESEQRHGRYSFAQADASQWAVWGFDYLKYDWYPNDVTHVSEMSEALRRSGRDVVFRPMTSKVAVLFGHRAKRSSGHLESYHVKLDPGA